MKASFCRGKIFFALLVTIIFLGFLLTQIRFKDLASALWKINFAWLSAAFAFFILAIFFRALRLKPLLNNKFNLFSLFNIVCVHDFFLNILPFRLGEFSYIYLINKSGKVSAGEGLSSLIIVRLFDFFAIFSLCFVSLYSVLKIKGQFLEQIFPYLAIIFFLFSAAFLLIFFFPVKLNQLLEAILRKPFLEKFKIVAFFREKIKETLGVICSMRFKKIFPALVINSLLVWLSFYLASFLLFKSLGLNLDFLQIVFIFSLPFVFSSFFIQGIAGLGTLEGSWAAGFMIFGVSKESAIASSFVVHGAVLFYLAVLAAFGFINLRFTMNKIKS